MKLNLKTRVTRVEARETMNAQVATSVDFVPSADADINLVGGSIRLEFVAPIAARFAVGDEIAITIGGK